MRSRVDIALTRGRPEQHYRDELRQLQGDLERVSTLASALLAIARSDSGHLQPQIASFDIAATINAAVDQYESAAHPETPAFVRDTRPTIVAADEDLMIQVLVNVLDNAIAHTPGSGSIAIGCRPTPTGAQFWIEDTGPGIPPVECERIFDRFYRLDSGRTRGAGGVGLGLTICRALITAQNGTIAAVEPHLSGARFEITLPAGDLN
jgi:signal transduction histidine kinase